MDIVLVMSNHLDILEERQLKEKRLKTSLNFDMENNSFVDQLITKINSLFNFSKKILDSSQILSSKNLEKFAVFMNNLITKSIKLQSLSEKQVGLAYKLIEKVKKLRSPFSLCLINNSLSSFFITKKHLPRAMSLTGESIKNSSMWIKSNVKRFKREKRSKHKDKFFLTEFYQILQILIIGLMNKSFILRNGKTGVEWDKRCNEILLKAESLIKKFGYENKNLNENIKRMMVKPRVGKSMGFFRKSKVKKKRKNEDLAEKSIDFDDLGELKPEAKRSMQIKKRSKSNFRISRKRTKSVKRKRESKKAKFSRRETSLGFKVSRKRSSSKGRKDYKDSFFEQNPSIAAVMKNSSNNYGDIPSNPHKNFGIKLLKIPTNSRKSKKGEKRGHSGKREEQEEGFDDFGKGIIDIIDRDIEEESPDITSEVEAMATEEEERSIEFEKYGFDDQEQEEKDDLGKLVKSIDLEGMVNDASKVSKENRPARKSRKRDTEGESDTDKLYSMNAKKLDSMNSSDYIKSVAHEEARASIEFNNKGVNLGLDSPLKASNKLAASSLVSLPNESTLKFKQEQARRTSFCKENPDNLNLNLNTMSIIDETQSRMFRSYVDTFCYTGSVRFLNECAFQNSFLVYFRYAVHRIKTAYNRCLKELKKLLKIGNEFYFFHFLIEKSNSSFYVKIQAYDYDEAEGKQGKMVWSDMVYEDEIKTIFRNFQYLDVICNIYPVSCLTDLVYFINFYMHHYIKVISPLFFLNFYSLKKALESRVKPLWSVRRFSPACRWKRAS